MNDVEKKMQLEAASNRDLEYGVLKRLMKYPKFPPEFKGLDADCFYHLDLTDYFAALEAGNRPDKLELEELVRGAMDYASRPELLVYRLVALKRQREAILRDDEASENKSERSQAAPEAPGRPLKGQRPVLGLSMSIPRLMYGNGDDQPPESPAAEPVKRSVSHRPRAHARSLSGASERLQSVAEARDELLTDYVEKQRRQAQDGCVGLATHLPRLNEVMGGLQAGGYILAGPPSSGKTTLARNLAHSIAVQDVPVLFVSFEESRKKLQMKTVLSAGNLDLTSYRDGKGSYEALYEASGPETALDYIYYVQGTRELTCDIIGDDMQTLMRKHRTERGFIVLDYLQRMSRTTQGGENMRIEVAKLFADLQEISLALDVPLLALSNVGKTWYQETTKITLASLKYASELEFDAYAVWALQDEPGPQQSNSPDVISAPRLTILKNRDGEQHTEIRLMFNKSRGLITEAVEPVESPAPVRQTSQNPRSDNRQFKPRSK